jgi:membrane fusion protein, multidrug efflux system
MKDSYMNRTGTLCFFLFCVGTSIALRGCTGNSGGDDETAAPINVQVHRVQSADGNQVFAYSGTIEESESTPLSFPGVGSVARVLVREGDYVTKGQHLATLNDESFKNAYEMSLASQKQAEDAYKRLQPMYKNGNLPEVKLVEVESDLQRAKAATMIAKKNLDDCILTSPGDGIVGKRAIEPGMNALPNVTSITIVKIDRVFARVSVSEHEISSIHKHQKAKVAVAALNNAAFEGTVDEVGVLADPVAHTYKIRIGINNKGRAIKPGMICDVVIRQATPSQTVVIPGGAVMVDETGRHYVYAVDTARITALRKYVAPGELLNDGIEILSGLRCGELVIVSGQHKLVDGSTVRIVNN